MKSQSQPVNTNPFPGLRPFLESEQHLFFGRESQIDAMVDKLAATRFLAVVGTSGSGKSSLVNCGLRPALQAGLMATAGSHWRIAQCRPGSDPIAALSQALASHGVLFHDFQEQGMSLHEIIDTTIRMGKLGLVDIVEQARLPEDCSLLLVVDQFEELFRYRHLSATGEAAVADICQHATAFVNLLLAAVEQTRLPVYIVITMRSDFLGDCAQFSGLAEAINRGQYLVPRMTREQRRSAIAGPVGVGGGKIYPALLSRLVNDVGENPDQLSILQHALNRTWAYWENERKREGMLDIECYEAIGSMSDALDRHADNAYAELQTERQRHLCASLFKALTDKASDPRGVRRPTRFNSLCDVCEASEAELIAVIDIFRKPSRSFLMPPEGVAIQSDTVIDISHESLMRVWKRLDRWATEEAEAANMYRRLSETADLNTEEKAGLLRNPDLRMALSWRDKNQPNASWARRYKPNFNLTMDFLARSEKSHRRRQLLQQGAIAAGVLSLLTVVAFGSYYINAQKLREAERQRQDAIDEKLLAENELADKQEDLVSTAISKARETQAKQAALDKIEELQEALPEILRSNFGTMRRQQNDRAGSSSTSGSGGNPVQDSAAADAQLAESVRRVQEIGIDIEYSDLPIAELTVHTDAQASVSVAADLARIETPVTDPSGSLPDNDADTPPANVPPANEFADNELPANESGRDKQSAFVTRFEVCEDVRRLNPIGCKSADQSIQEGKVYVFARVVTQQEKEMVRLSLYKGDAKRAFVASNFTIHPNSDGYRVYTWRTLQSGQYRACLSDQTEQEIDCIPIVVN